MNLAIIANSITLKLSYLNNISSSVNILESSLQYPILECLERRLGYKDIILEFPHPTFSQKRCDLYWKDNNNNKCLMEMKYLKFGKNYKDVVLTDIIRQYFAHNKGYNTYFLLCFRFDEFQKKIFDAKNKTKITTDSILDKTINKSSTKKIENPYNKWLSFNRENITTTTKLCSTRNKVYKNIITKYDFKKKDQEFQNQIIFKTKLIHLTKRLENIPLTHQVGIWEILD